jgi:hypothetical protein
MSRRRLDFGLEINAGAKKSSLCVEMITFFSLQNDVDFVQAPDEIVYSFVGHEKA